MEIKIQGSVKEIADLVVALQGQPVKATNSADPLKIVTNRMIQAIHDKDAKEQAK